MTDVVWSIDISTGQRVASARSYAKLLAAVSGKGTLAELYPIAGPKTDLTRIARFVESGGALFLIEPAILSRVTDSQYGTQVVGSPTTGLTRTLGGGHNMPAAGFVTVWDVSGATEIATTAAFTVSGNTITFASDPGVTSTGDLFHVEGRCEFGELRERANGGLWVPYPGALCVWSGGLATRVESVRLVFAQVLSTNLHPSLRFVADVARTTSTLNDVVGCGVLHDSDTRANGCAWHYNGINWGRTVLRNGIDFAWVYNHGADAGTPGDPTVDVEFNLTIYRQSTGDSGVALSDVTYTGETLGSAVSVASNAFLIGGPSGDSLLVCDSPGDDIRITLKELEL